MSVKMIITLFVIAALAYLAGAKFPTPASKILSAVGQ